MNELEVKAAPKPSLSVFDAVALIVGIVVGAGIFKTPSLVAQNTGSSSVFLLVWLLGGVISLIGALCYAELSTTYPNAGGDYYYFTRAFGKALAFLYAWARLAVIQTGSIALLAFIFGDYLSQLLPVANSAVYAALAVILFTGLNLVGVKQGRWTQVGLTAAKVLGLLLVILASFALPAPVPVVSPAVTPTQPNLGLALVFVLLTYGGWNEVAFLGAELHQVQRNMTRALLWGISSITGIYLLINLAFLHGLGLAGVERSQVVAADLMRQPFGEMGAKFISALIAVSVLGALNATIFTGARTNYALGKDFPLFRALGRWHERANTPQAALLVQGAIALFLVLLGSLTRKGFETMVDYTAPVFWLFFLLTGVALLVLRVREPQIPRPFRVPAYPLPPLLFCLTCSYLLYSSLVYTGVGGLVGVAVLAIGVLVWLVNGRLQAQR